MPGLVPGIHVFKGRRRQDVEAGDVAGKTRIALSPGMTEYETFA